MKRLAVIILFVLVGISFAKAQTTEASKTGPTISFIDKSKDFGDITEGDTVSHVFVFTNTGTEPLIVSDVVTTCGCTAPSWSKQPVMPGQSGEIHVTFKSAGKSGRQNKVVTVLSNAKNHRTTVSMISNVLPKK